MVRLDLSTADAPHAHASGAPGLTDSVRVVGSLGSLEALALVSALVAVALLVRRSWSALAAWLVAVLGGEALNLLLKDLFARPRPHFEHPLVVEASYGFPSGQAMGGPWRSTGCSPASPYSRGRAGGNAGCRLVGQQCW